MRRERGSVTAETAIVLPAIVLVIAALVGVITVVTAQLRCQDAAREAARAAARAETPNVVSELARRAAPAGSATTVTTAGDQITVTVRARVRILGGLLSSVTVTSHAVALAEPSVDDSGPPNGAVPRFG